MSVLTENKDVEQREGTFRSYPVVASDIIYRGALVMINAAGFLAPCSASAGAIFAGVSYEKKDNSAGAAGDKRCRVQRVESFLLEGTGFVQADVGSTVYASDDQTITLTYAANLVKVGVIDEFISSTKVGVRLDADKSEGAATIADPTGGGTADTEARSAINDILDILQENKLMQG